MAKSTGAHKQANALTGVEFRGGELRGMRETHDELCGPVTETTQSRKKKLESQ